MNYFRELHGFIKDLILSPSRNEEQRLFYELEQAKARFLKLFDVPPRNPTERMQVESGKVVIRGKTYTFNDESKQEALFLAQELGCSERFCAELLHHVMQRDPNLGRSATAEKALMEFHAERREQLACLRTIIQGALQRDAIEPRLVHMFEKFTIELLGATTELGGKHGKGRFVEKLLIEIDNIKAAIAKQRVALQSAPSASVQYQYQPQTIAANQPVARFGDEVVRARIKFLQQERRQLGHILYIVAAARELKSSDISKLVQWLSTSEGPEEGLTIYILTAVFAAVDPSPDVGVDENLALNSLFSDRELFLSMNRVVNQSNWTSPELKAAVLLQWSLFLLEDRRRDPNLQGDASVVEDEVEGIVRGAVEGDAFKCLSHLTVIARARGSGEDLVDEFSVLEGVRRDEGERVDYVEPEFYPYLLSQLETLVTSLIINMGSILRKIKTREEDVLLSRTHQHVHHRSFSALDPPKPPRNDIEAFFRLIAVIYSEMEPDAGLRFWIDEDGKLLGFLRWAAESRNLGMIIAMYDMLASLSKGPSCSSYAYNFLSGGGQYPMPGATHVSGSCSWQSLFGALEYYATNLPNPRNIQAPVAASRMNLSSLNPGAGLHSSAPQPVSLPPEEILMLRSFLRLLRTVALYSPTARAALQENPSFRAISALLTLVTCSIPLELKASLFETLAAFCSPGGGTTSADNVRQMWIALERAEVLPVRGGSSAPSGSLLSSRFGRTSGGGGGVLFELEQVETVGKTYPATIAFIHLLNSLIHTPGGSLTLETESSTVPENLGAGYRTPGIIPYIRFVIDDVFLKAGSREYLSAPEKWKVCDACLCFLEKCLASYDLSVLQGADFSEFNVANPSAKTVATLTSLVAHPGFEVLTRVLSDVRLRDELFFLAEQGFTAMQKNIGGTHFANKTILRSLRIIHRVLGIQGLFLEGLVPLVNGIDNLPGFGQVSLAARGLNSMDQWLLWRGKIVPQIGLYVNSVDDDEMALLSIQILTALSESPSFNSVPQHMPGLPARKLNTLAVLLEESDCLSNILDGFVRLLGVDAEDEEDPSPDPNGPTSHTHAIRSAILNLLLQNTQHGRPAPNLAHLLLGFEARGASNEVAIEDPKATNSRVSCLHVVLELLGEKVPRLDRSESRSSQANQSPLFLRRPALAEKCYRLVHQLCVHPFTSRATLRYLRTREDFFARQLSVFPIKPPSVRGDEMGEVAYADHSRVLTTCATLTSFLRLRSWILECVALELHVLTDAGQQQRIDRLLEILFGSSESVLMKDVDNLEGALLGHSPGQSLIRVLEILESLILEWHDGVMVQDVQLHFYANINWDACLRTDDSGCQIFDERAILSLLTTVRRQLQQQGSLAAEGVQEQLKRETKYVLQSATVENHRRQIDHAKGAAFESWRRIITVVLAQCFGRLPHDRREGVLFDILQTLPSLIVEPSIAPQTAILLSEVMLSLITKVREDRHHQLILQSTAEDSFTASLPTDRLHVLFKSILECILQKGTTERVRGNLYSALINYIHLVFSPEERAQPSSSSDLPLEGNSSMFASTTHAPSDLGSSFLGRSQLGHADATKRSALEIGTLSIVNTLVDRLIPVICRDAVDGSEVWKTVAFTLLDALIRLSRVEKSHRVLSTIVRQGFLQNFVQSIRDSGRDLQLVLKPDPASLNSLYVYEAKMSLLIRIAQTRQGADRLAESRLFYILSQCEFFSARPENDQDFLDYDTFLPSAVERYHQILLPTLQLAASMLSTAGSGSAFITKQALDFIYAHRETIAGLIADNSSHVSVSVLRELQLLMCICSFVLPQVKDEDLLDSTSFKQIHAAVLSLAARSLNRQRWNVSVSAANDTEQTESQIAVRGYGRQGSIWSEKVETSVRRLQKWVTVYLGSVIDRKNDVFRPVLSSNTPMKALEGGATSHVDSKVPTVMDSIVALRVLVQELSSALEQVNDISSKLENPGEVGVDEIEEIVTCSGIDFLEELDIPQRRVIAFSELGKAWERSKNSVLDKLRTYLPLVDVSTSFHF